MGSAAVHTHLLRHLSLRSHHALLLRDSHMLLHNDLDKLKRELTLPQGACREYMSSNEFSQCTYQSGHWRDRRQLKPILQPQEQMRDAESCSMGKEDGENSTGNQRSTGRIPTTWGTWGSVQPVVFPSELVAAFEVEHVDILDPRLVFLPSKLPLYVGKRRKARASLRECQTACVEFPPCQPSAGEKAKQGAGQQEIPQAFLQKEQPKRQEHQKLVTRGALEQPICEVQICVNGKCNEVRACLSRHRCAAILR